MRLVKQSAELIKQEPGYEGLLRHIERCGRVCYKSEDKITEGSAEKFVEMIIKNGHHSVLEHGECVVEGNVMGIITPQYSRLNYDKDALMTVTNYRCLTEEMNPWYIKEHLLEDTSGIEPNIRRVTFHVITSRAILDELLRHRTLSASVESTRFCDYTKGKFGGELTFIEPSDWGKWTSKQRYESEVTLDGCAVTYKRLIKSGIKPQRARDILPLSIKSEAYLTAFVDDWVDIFHKRITPAAHPDMVELATMMRYELFKNKYITFEDVTKLEV